MTSSASAKVSRSVASTVVGLPSGAVKPSFASSRGALGIGVGRAERRISAVGSTSRVWVKPQRIAGKLRQLARVTWASGAGGLPRMPRGAHRNQVASRDGG